MGRLIIILLLIAGLAYLGILIYEGYVQRHTEKFRLKYRLYRKLVDFDFHYLIQYQLPVTKRWKVHTRKVGDNDNVVVDHEYKHQSDAENALLKLHDSGKASPKVFKRDTF